MNSQIESQHPLSTSAVKEIRVQDNTPGKIQVQTVFYSPFQQASHSHKSLFSLMSQIRDFCLLCLHLLQNDFFKPEASK